MSSRLKKAQRLGPPCRGGSPDSAKHAHTSSSNEAYMSSRDAGDPSADEDSTALDVDFADTGIEGFLDADPRPTFVLALDADLDAGFAPIFANASLRSNLQLVKALAIRTRSNSPQLSPKISTIDFRAWLKDISQVEDLEASGPGAFSFWGFLWTGFTLRKKWIIISGSSREMRSISGHVSFRGESSASLAVQQSEARKSRTSPPKPADDVFGQESPLDATAHSMFMSGVTPDWTRPQPEAALSPHAIFARSIDWGNTPLGDMSTWSPEFRQIVCLLMASPHPRAIFWGDELTVMYNDAYAKTVAGIKHPTLMGTGFKGPFKEIWSSISAIFEECRRTGQSVAVEDQMLPINRRGFEEETYYTWSLTPLYGGTDTLLGLYNAPFETTRRKIGDRRNMTLLKLSEAVALSKTVSNFWVQVLKSLEANEFDFPFALLYSVTDDTESDGSSVSSESSQSMKSCVLEGTLGVPDGHPSAPTRLDLKRARGGFIPSFREAMQTREPKLLNIADGTLSESLMEGFHWRGFPEPCSHAVVCPIRPTTGENVIGFLVVGINPRRPYDDDYKAFISLLNRQLATSLASVTLFEEEIKRSHTTEVERSRLSEELAVQRSLFQRIAEASPVGMFSVTDTGKILEANDRYFEITGISRHDLNEISWMSVFKESSMQILKEGWARVTEDGMPWSAELELKKDWFDPTTGETNDCWILGNCTPEFSEDGTLKAVMGSITDISLQKQSAKDAEARAQLSEQLLLRTQEAEALHRQRLKEAEETRRQQNNFIDITSHEMRNPLSAIVQCADSISMSMKELQEASPDLSPDLVAIFQANIDAAETIQLCASHQKNIVNDILTISKLDSNLLLITPVPVQPVKVLEQCLKMFKSELQIGDIKMEHHIDASFENLHVDSVMLDSSRLLQVLINLMTNAIKFTKSEARRSINVTLSAHLEPPTEGAVNFQYFPTKKVRSDFITGPDWGTGEVLYLRWEVRDTGCGITENEKKNLFTRFSQASPRTHVQYGGSGLGLFISRQLTELQGGEIGVASEAGVGSTFAFYLKSRRAEVEINENAAETRLNADLQSNARLATNVPKDLKAHDESLSRLIHYNTSSSSLATQASTSASASASTSQPPLDPSLWHVLIVEDNVVNQRILAQQIRKLGCTVHVANHGEEALSVLRSTRHFKGNDANGTDLSVILMDLEMPVMDGLTCVRHIREMELTGDLRVRLPIIAVTANARGEQIAAAKDSGMDDVMSKPFRIKQLVPKIKALLTKRHE